MQVLNGNPLNLKSLFTDSKNELLTNSALMSLLRKDKAFTEYTNEQLLEYFNTQLVPLSQRLEEYGISNCLELLKLIFWIAENRPELMNSVMTHHLSFENATLTIDHPAGYSIALGRFVTKVLASRES